MIFFFPGGQNINTTQIQIQEQFIKQAKKGDQESLNKLFDILELIKKMSFPFRNISKYSPHTDYDDFVQTVFLHIWKDRIKIIESYDEQKGTWNNYIRSVIQYRIQNTYSYTNNHGIKQKKVTLSMSQPQSKEDLKLSNIICAKKEVPYHTHKLKKNISRI